MRLSATDQERIISIFRKLSPGPFQLKLFGSRTDDLKRGGDIDLLLIVSESDLDAFKKIKFKVLDALYEKIGEQRIDLVITTPERVMNDAFLRSIQGINL